MFTRFQASARNYACRRVNRTSPVTIREGAQKSIEAWALVLHFSRLNSAYVPTLENVPFLAPKRVRAEA